MAQLKTRPVNRLRAAQTPAGRVEATISLMLVMAGSKFLVLELTALAFGDSVQLGEFFPVTALILCLMLALAGTRHVLARTDRKDPRDLKDPSDLPVG